MQLTGLCPMMLAPRKRHPATDFDRWADYRQERIDIEIDPGYFAIAERRIAEAQLQRPLFPNREIKLTRISPVPACSVPERDLDGTYVTSNYA